MKDYFQLIPAVFVMLQDGDKVLLIRRLNTGWRDGEYTLPSGHLDGNETARVAATREVKEEVGVDVKPEDVDFVHVIHRRGDEGDHERVDFFFKARKYSGKPYNAEPKKCDDIGWFSLDSLPEKTIPMIRHALEQISASKFYSDVNF